MEAHRDPRAESRAGHPCAVLVFAHTPPPHHGQSAMVKLMLDALGSRPGPPPPELQVYHIDARLSRTAEDVGDARAGKLPLLLKYCARALVLRFRHGVRVFYYVPAPPARTPLYRDWLVMLLCRPFFPRLVLHWHAGGLSEFLETQASGWERWLSLRLLGRPDLSIVLRPFNRRDADYLGSKRIEAIPNGLADPCPDFDHTLLPGRRQAAAARAAAWAQPGTGGVDESAAGVFRVLYLSLCRREKGLFDLLDAVALANAGLRGANRRIQLTVAGEFWSADDRAAFVERVGRSDLAQPSPLVKHVGFVSGKAKDEVLRSHDCLCLPTYLPEGFPLTFVEAMAYGLPIITTNFRQLHEVLPAGYRGVVDPKSPDQLAARLLEFAGRDYDPALRAHFLENFTVDRFAARLRAAFCSV